MKLPVPALPVPAYAIKHGKQIIKRAEEKKEEKETGRKRRQESGYGGRGGGEGSAY